MAGSKQQSKQRQQSKLTETLDGKLVGIRAKLDETGEDLVNSGKQCLEEAGIRPKEATRRAFDLFSRAAQKGSAEAQAQLASMYLDGAGVEKSEEKAQMCLQKAEAQGWDCTKQQKMLMRARTMSRFKYILNNKQINSFVPMLSRKKELTEQEDVIPGLASPKVDEDERWKKTAVTANQLPSFLRSRDPPKQRSIHESANVVAPKPTASVAPDAASLPLPSFGKAPATVPKSDQDYRESLKQERIKAKEKRKQAEEARAAVKAVKAAEIKARNEAAARTGAAEAQATLSVQETSKPVSASAVGQEEQF